MHAFLNLAWNCTTRLGDIGEIKYEHLSFDDDHIVIVIPCNKANPTGELTSTGKSIYANAVHNRICPFLAIGILVLSRTSLKNLERIFLGSKAEENINTWLKEANNTNYLNTSSLTSHCTRKGSASYVSSLSGLANVLAVISRVRWIFLGVLSFYITQENGGDQMVSNNDYFILFATKLVYSTLTLHSH